MSTELIINASLPETRIALMENGEIQDLLIERASGKGIVGNIYKGRVTRVLPGMQAAFVDIGLEKAAFLYVDDVFVHSEIWEEEEGPSEPSSQMAEGEAPVATVVSEPGAAPQSQSLDEGQQPSPASDIPAHTGSEDYELSESDGEDLHQSDDDLDQDQDDPENEDEEDDEEGPVGMGPPPEGEDDNGGNSDVPGTISAPVSSDQSSDQLGGQPPVEGQQGQSTSEKEGGPGRRRHRRGRRGGRIRRGREKEGQNSETQKTDSGSSEEYPENFNEQVADSGGGLDSDRGALTEDRVDVSNADQAGEVTNRPDVAHAGGAATITPRAAGSRPEFKEPRARDRRVRSKAPARSVRQQVNIQDLLKEGQEVIVQVAKDPIATKGARLTCHISLPGRHLVCMPTIDHVGVSRRIERDDERRRLRDFVERNRPKNLGFIVRTASGRQASAEKRIKQDVDYLVRLWGEIREKAGNVTAPALVYEDLNSVLRAIRDWVTEDIDKIIVDSRYHYNEMQRFVSHFMPSLRQKVELYHGDVPIFDAYNISTELSRSLERKVWLKSGGYLVIDQAEALVAIDVNTGRYVGKKNLEDTILKTNLEAVQEIAYQLRLRNCGGIIILDLIDMEKEENKQRVYRALEEALKRDRARPSILKISELGLVEMTRKRTRDTIVRALCESCSHCEGKGFIKSKQTVAYEIMRELEREGIERDLAKILVQAHPDVIDILAIDERETLDQLERRYRKQIYLQASPDFHAEQFEVIGDKGDRPQVGGREQPAHDRGSHSSHSRGQAGERNDSRNESRNDRNRGRGGNRDRGGRDGGRDASRENQAPQPPKNPNQIKITSSGPSGRPQIIMPNGGIIPVGEAIVPAAAPVITPVPGGVPVVQNVADESSPGNSMNHEANAEPRSGNGSGGDDFYDEEDRLAFLRAQATQDAALAKFHGGAPGGNGTAPQGRGPGGGRNGADRGPNGGAGGAGGDNRRRGRRGGRFRKDRGPAQQRPMGAGPSGIKSAGIVARERVEQQPGAPATAPASAGSSGPATSNDQGGGGNGEGGGGDHSQPPT